MSSLVTLTTDFGEREPYVAVVKGVLHSRSPGVQVVDLSHDIPRGEVMEAALFLARAAPYFPAGTVHVVGVAPGPTSIVVSLNRQHVVCPDNGVVTLLAERYEIESVHDVRTVSEGASRAGQTYYARDVFAPAAASLVSGAAPRDLGEPRDRPVFLDLPKPKREGPGLVVGEIVHIDRFGNLLTNIHRADLGGARVTNVQAGHFPVGGLSTTYSAVPAGKPLALYGSADYVEIAYNRDRADARLELGKGIIVKVTIATE